MDDRLVFFLLFQCFYSLIDAFFFINCNLPTYLCLFYVILIWHFNKHRNINIDIFEISSKK